MSTGADPLERSRVRRVGLVPETFLENPYSQTIGSLPGVESIVHLPDIHIKQKYIDAGYSCVVPSSCVIASSPEHLYPQFRSRGIGCGMALWPLGVEAGAPEDTEQADPREADFVRGVFRTLLERPPFLTVADQIIGRRAPQLPNVVPRGRYGLRRSEWWPALVGGARDYLRAREPVQADAVLAAFEAEGNHLDEVPGDHPARPEGHFSDGLRQGQDFSGGDREAGLWLRGNHYLELQRVSHVYDAEAARRCGLAGSSLAVMSHSCGNGLEFVLSQAFADRAIRLDRFRSIAPDDPDYALVRFAVGLLKNLGSLRRATLYRRLADAARSALPDAGVRLLTECNHNDIEWTGDRIVYRHNALKLRPGRVQIVSGSYNHPSYLIEPGPNADETYHTVGHGLGVWLNEQRFEPDPRRHVLRMGLEQRGDDAGRFETPVEKLERLPYFAGDPGDRVLLDLEALGIIRLIAKLSPVISANHVW